MCADDDRHDQTQQQMAVFYACDYIHELVHVTNAVGLADYTRTAHDCGAQRRTATWVNHNRY
ncbi:hypothetical protein BDZ85DRAFT_7763 [Elsinoe ampelina]|uniref:Uncharacterized protein n=1 Tax=Elsinoe ampelina TaxID=302913 RepID=A0A6A6GQ02_9PEZI|nr:hypothetical protein BDZ85DRAFT_7763 [Elsinoe ampelina]